MEEWHDPKSRSDVTSRMAKLHDELTILRQIERHFEQAIQPREQPNENGNPKDLKKVLFKIRAKIRRLEQNIWKRS